MNLPVTNTLVQLLALYTDPESQCATLQTDGRTDNWIMPIANHTVAVQSANERFFIAA